MRKYKRSLRLKNKIRTKRDLFILKNIIYKILKHMNISYKELKKINVRFARDYELGSTCNASLILKENQNNEIIIKRNLKTYITLGDLAHELGHEVTILGKFGLYGKRRRNILGEISAYNFTKQFIDKFNEHMRTSLSFNRVWQGFFSSPVHCISRLLVDVPLGSLINSKYKNR